MELIRVGTRGSPLARAQADKVCRILESSGIKTEQVIISTVGDEQTSVPLHEIGGVGVFVRALDDAILGGKIDIAVHSMKDIPAERPAGLYTGAILPRDSPCDYLVTDHDIDEIQIIGTSSTRRTAQIGRNMQGVSVKPLRGNVDTRLKRLRNREYDGIILAEAGLQRLSLELPGFRMDPSVHVPSTNQGTIAVVGKDNPDTRDILSVIDDKTTRTDTLIERTVMELIGGGCYTPLGIFCHDTYLITEVLSLEGDRAFRLERKIRNISDAKKFGLEVREGAGDLIREAYLRLGLGSSRGAKEQSDRDTDV